MEKILIIGAFAEPNSTSGNSLLASQASELQEIGHEVKILTRPRKIAWTGPFPDRSKSELFGVPYLETKRYDLSFLVTLPPRIWCDRSAEPSDWRNAVIWAQKVLQNIHPDIVHLNSWQDLWYFMEASIDIKLPTYFSVYDYGVPCIRIQLLTGDKKICDGKISLEKCTRCNLMGLSPLQRLLEGASLLPFGPLLLKKLYGKDAEGILGQKYGLGACYSSAVRIQRLHQRFQSLFQALDGIIVTSPFAKDLFAQSGINRDRIHVLPWFYSQTRPVTSMPDSKKQLKLGFIARLIEHKGLHILLEALEEVDPSKNVSLKIAGRVDSQYSTKLQAHYPDHAGSHEVEWKGWVPNGDLGLFFSDVDVVVVPSIFLDNTPTAMVEALAHGRPILCSDLPSLTHLAQPGVNALSFPVGNVLSLKAQIEYLVDHPELVLEFSMQTRNVLSAHEYAVSISQIYQSPHSKLGYKASQNTTNES